MTTRKTHAGWRVIARRPLLAGLAAALVLAAGIGGGLALSESSATDPASITEDADAATSTTLGGSVVPDTFLTFDVGQYRLDTVIQADLVAVAEFVEVGTAVEADIELPGPIAVFARAGDDIAVYTFSPASGDGETGVASLWLRWVTP